METEAMERREDHYCRTRATCYSLRPSKQVMKQEPSLFRAEQGEAKQVKFLVESGHAKRGNFLLEPDNAKGVKHEPPLKGGKKQRNKNVREIPCMFHISGNVVVFCGVIVLCLFFDFRFL